MRLAIVGSQLFEDDEQARAWAEKLISRTLAYYGDQIEMVISGGAKGIDQLGIVLAVMENLPYIEYLPTSKNWVGYKARNILIAEDCTHLLCLTHHKSKTYGSGWTADHAQKLGKNVRRFTWKG